MNAPIITAAQRTAVAALNLPFSLSDSDIARQFAADGSTIDRPLRNPMARVRSLSRAAMDDQVTFPLAA